MSIPRDLRTDIPGHGRAKINAAYSYGGRQARAQDDRAACWGCGSTTSSGSLRRLPRRDRPPRLRLQRRRPPLLPLEPRPPAVAAVRRDQRQGRLPEALRAEGARLRALPPHGLRPRARGAPAAVHLGRPQPGRRRQPLPQPHAAPADLRPRTCRPTSARRRASCGLLKLVAESSGKPLQPVRLQVVRRDRRLGRRRGHAERDPGGGAALPGRPGQPEGDRDAPHAPAGPSARAAPAGPPRPVPSGLYVNGGPGRGRSRPGSRSSCGTRLPVYYPTAHDELGELPGPDSRSYSIRDRSGKPHKAYRIVAYEGHVGQYYGVQGTTWQSPPILDDPLRDADGARPQATSCTTTATACASSPGGPASACVLGRRTRCCAHLSNKQMLAIARSLTRVGS